jgi:hypothetical protein
VAKSYATLVPLEPMRVHLSLPIRAVTHRPAPEQNAYSGIVLASISNIPPLELGSCAFGIRSLLRLSPPP